MDPGPRAIPPGAWRQRQETLTVWRPGERHAALAVLIALVLAACSSPQLPAAPPASSGGAASAGAGEGTQPAPSQSGSQDCGEWSCAQQGRFSRASEAIAGVHGYLGMVVRDRQTGAAWQAGAPEHRIWAGSTPKLALALALREQDRTGEITLDSKAKQQIAAMLAVSDNAAADGLWDRYVDATAMMKRFQDRYGMTTAGYVDGFPRRWGFVKCSAVDLAQLMSYILERADPADRGYLVQAMRSVGPVQRWGVWGAGAAMRPGVKDGWSIERDDGKDHWITATVGFAGDNERYVVAAMYHQPPGGDSIDRGVHVLTDLVATVFDAPVPAPAAIPEDY